MEIRISADLEVKIARIAAEQGREASDLVNEAVERFISYDEWFIREAEKGIAAADRGELVEHADVEKLIKSRYPG